MKPKSNQGREHFAVIDTETTWNDEVMSIGIVIADSVSFVPVDKKYYILTPECNFGGMYSYVMLVKGIKVDLKSSRLAVLKNLIDTLQTYYVKSIFAYNASFDYKHLPELQKYMWFDIMKLAAYKQYNKKIPETAECWGTGRLKRNYGVEPIMRMLSGNCGYCEVHNAICDAVDELKIIKLLGHAIEKYNCAQINPVKKSMSKRTSELRMVHKPQTPLEIEPCEIEESIKKRIIADCKYAVGNGIKHKAFGYGIIRNIEVINEEILLLIVRYETVGVSRHLLPDDEHDITLINK